MNWNSVAAFSRRRPGSVLVALVILAVAVSGLLYWQGFIRLAYPDHEVFPVRGIDISHHQGVIDWTRVAGQGVHFVYIKASEGGDRLDPFYATNMAEAQSRGFRVGAYHFFTLCKPGSEQARNFLALLPLNVDLPPVADLEFGGNCAARPTQSEFERELDAFVRAVVSARGRVPVLYATEEFYNAYIANSPFASSPLWVRDIFAGMSWPNGGRVVFRQFANNGRVDGIVGPVDLNHFVGSHMELETAFPRRQ